MAGSSPVYGGGTDVLIAGACARAPVVGCLNRRMRILPIAAPQKLDKRMAAA